MKITRFVQNEEAIAKISNFSFFEISSESYGINRCIINEPSFQEAINIAKRVHYGIDKQFLVDNGCYVSHRWSGCYTQNMDKAKSNICEDEVNECAAYFVQCESRVNGGSIHYELIFAIWRLDKNGFCFKLIDSCTAQPEGPYVRLLFNKVENNTLHYSKTPGEDYKILLKGLNLF